MCSCLYKVLTCKSLPRTKFTIKHFLRFLPNVQKYKIILKFYINLSCGVNLSYNFTLKFALLENNFIAYDGTVKLNHETN